MNSCVKVEINKPIDEAFIYSVINPSDSTSLITITNVYKFSEKVPLDSGKAINNCIVTIKGPNGVKNFSFDNKLKKYVANTKNYFLEEKEYQLMVKNGNNEYSATTLIPRKNLLQLKKINIDNENINVEFNILKFNDNIENIKIEGYVNLEAPTFLFYYWGNIQGLWRTRIEKSGISNVPIGNFLLPKNINSATLNVKIQTQDDIYSDFEKKLVNIQNRTPFSKNFESPLFFKFNVKGALGIFCSYSENNQIIKITR